MNTLQPFLIGGFSGMFATTIIQPIDTIKVRIQILSEEKSAGNSKLSTNPIAIAKNVIKSDGISGLYKGIDSALMRQVLYTTVRLGLFKTLTDNIKAKKGGKNLTFGEKVYCSLTAGFVGSLCGNPADLALVRFQGDTLLPIDQRRNYKNIFDALRRIVSEEGVLALWKGCSPTVVRAMLLNLGMLSTFDEAKERLNEYTKTTDTLQTQVIASALSGIVASVMSLPIDNIKTKLQRQKPDAQGNVLYKGFTDCFTISVRREGFLGLWVGLPTFITRIAPHVVITLLVQDSLTKYFNKRKQL
ncbi:mitochondrial carrier protein, putative [Ichthyophthirius multifiliis]|uniref:Mitochondrial carrier protein, putative n=1 Tax=Ichthyophthirius multifiliis TaxID=5932 RepID=G0QRB2_ICHMU|nr:mitochondrial carrier protein, putative [Ichthyophthirius multifiliis]EGR32264.1 mitochondrial carrier protein, putative [Ichthyophthirius multifiliis]|eukprot:XP_004035750.1 mitochondrial carrier protein, putative [Ichthyophthirius multifiliis]